MPGIHQCIKEIKSLLGEKIKEKKRIKMGHWVDCSGQGRFHCGNATFEQTPERDEWVRQHQEERSKQEGSNCKVPELGLYLACARSGGRPMCWHQSKQAKERQREWGKGGCSSYIGFLGAMEGPGWNGYSLEHFKQMKDPVESTLSMTGHTQHSHSWPDGTKLRSTGEYWRREKEVK